MRFLKALFPAVLALAITLAAFSAPARAAVTPTAQVPTWTVGQAVGYGTHIDLGSIANPYLAGIRADPSAYNISTVNALNLTGSFDSWEVDTVTQATPTYYTLAMQSASGFKLHFVENLTLKNVPKAGTYPGTVYGSYCFPPTVPTTTGIEAVTLDATALNTGNVARRLQTSDLSFVNETDNEGIQANIVFTGYHLPTMSLNQTSCQETVSYENPTFTLTVDSQDVIRVFYGAYNFFNFPISDNNTWTASADATIGATLSGTINVQGLSSQDEKSFFDNLTKSFQSVGITATGLNSFPIDLAKVSLYNPVTGYIVNNGTVTDYPYKLSSGYRAISAVQTLSDNNQHQVFLIANESYQCPPPSGTLIPPVSYAAVYAPDFPAAGAGMIVGYELLVCGGTSNIPGLALTNTKPSDAAANRGQTENTYQAFPSPVNPLVAFFTQAPYLGLILVAVVVVAVAALLLMRRRRKPAMAPPPQQPPASPPGNP